MALFFPAFVDHDKAHCFSCNRPITHGRWVRSGDAPGRGEFYQDCGACGMRTWYDLQGVSNGKKVEA